MSAEDEEPEVVDSDEIEIEAAPAREEQAETRSAEARRKLREQMEAEIEAFLKAGGKIEQVSPHERARPPSISASTGDVA